MDDKGTTLVVLWGISPMTSTNDAERAIYAGFGIRK